jgi:hypothetical protein
MKGSLTLYKPIKQRSKSAITANMFQQDDSSEPLPHLRDQLETYDFVGPTEFRKKLLVKVQPAKREEPQPEELLFNETARSKNAFNSTINRNTMMSSLHREQQIEITKQTRNLERYKEYQEMWERKKGLLRQELQRKTPLLMENNIKSLYAQPNQPKDEVINDFIVHYWEMSLRNHHPILERHIKGHRFSKVQKEQLLQLRDGIKKVEQSIPQLPLQKLAHMQAKDLSLSGRNKVKREAEAESERSATRYSVPNSARLAQEEVLVIDYEGGKRWMGSENL